MGQVSGVAGGAATGDDLTVRKAAAADVPVILQLIRGIAEYERLPHEVEATEALLREHGFGARPIFEALIAERTAPQAPTSASPGRATGGEGRGIPSPTPRQAVGFALYFFTFSTFKARPTLYLEDLFVLPEERRHGIGRRLLGELARIAVDKGCGRMEWSVLDWNAPARDFYFKIGATAMDAWTVFRLTPDAFGRLAEEALSAARR